MSTGALIAASLDYDKGSRGSEEVARFLPMMPIGGITAIKKEIATLRKAGISPIMVLCGYQKELLKNHLSHNNVIFCEDPDFGSHTQEETVEVGLAFASGLCDSVLLIPVQTPVFSVDTIKRLAECEESTIPVFQGRRGRQRLIRFGQEKKEEDYGVLEVEDEGILYSLDEDEGLERVCDYLKKLRNSNDLKVKQKVILGKENDFFGPGTYQLLLLIEETGSIQAAAARLGMSYTKSWKLINRAEQEMGFPFLKRCNGGRNGGNSTLTEEGRRFMERYHALVEDMNLMTQNFFDVYFRDFQ